ncbi:MAG TPA: glycosyltransferase family 9 protein [Nocardioidaceae bacterium]|nr:glycosyltransferase family 9 protein [Ornithinibacter sp.]HET9758830.1 glycosyltransferase family 9 protein [Nocardioidaceae bacterium]
MTDVLVLRALGLGDLLTSVAALRGLRRAWPGARVVLAAPAALGGWLVTTGVVDDAVAVRGLHDGAVLASRTGAPDVVVNLHGRGPQSHHLLAGLRAQRLVGFACPEGGFDEGPQWHDDEHEVDRWIRLALWAGGTADADDLRLPSQDERSTHVVVHPGAASASRRWPAGRWAAVAAVLAADGHPVVVTGTRAEAALCAEVAAAAPSIEDACGRHDLPGLGHLVGTAALVLSGDTGVAHVATAYGTPSVTIFGPVSPALWGARIDPHLHVALWPASAKGARPGDPHGSAPDERLLATGVAEVVEAATALLEPLRAHEGARPDTQ